jgi:hypothetical protein
MSKMEQCQNGTNKQKRMRGHTSAKNRQRRQWLVLLSQRFKPLVRALTY